MPHRRQYQTKNCTAMSQVSKCQCKIGLRALYIMLMTTVSKQSLQQLHDFLHLQHMYVLVWQVNDYQIRLRGMTRRMMATVSELSMYQAHSIKLSADKEALEEVVMAASDKLEVWEESVCLCIAQCS